MEREEGKGIGTVVPQSFVLGPPLSKSTGSSTTSLSFIISRKILQVSNLLFKLEVKLHATCTHHNHSSFKFSSHWFQIRVHILNLDPD